MGRTEDVMSLEELFSDEFMVEHTSSARIQDFISCSPVKPTTALLTDEVQDPDFEDYVKTNSKYDSWGSLIVAAFNDYLVRNFN